MKKILGILPISIGGRLTTSSILDGFRQNDYDVFVFDELKNENFTQYIQEYDYIVGYDFSPIKLKIDYNLKIPCIAYFSDDIDKKTSGVGFLEYKKYLKNEDIYVFYWDRALSKICDFRVFYQPHFVNCEIYYDFDKPKNDILFMGRFDTDLRLETFLNLNKQLSHFSFEWYAIERHYQDALNRCSNEDKNIIQKAYRGFIDNEKQMAQVINNSKIVYNINAQGVSSLNYRTIQTLACKRLIISDERKELDIFNNFVPKYKNFDDLVEKIKFYLSNSNKYNEVVEYCANIVREKLNSKNCVLNMLNAIVKS